MTQEQTQNNMTAEAVNCLKSIGFDLKTIRKALPALSGLTHPVVAKSLGVARTSVTNTMNGERTNFELQRRIADAYGVPVEAVFEQRCVCERCRREIDNRLVA